MIKPSDKSNLKGKEFIVVHSFMVQSITAQESSQQGLEAAVGMVSTIRKGEQRMLAAP